MKGRKYYSKIMKNEFPEAEAVLRRIRELERANRRKRKMARNPKNYVQCSGCGTLSTSKADARQHREVCLVRKCSWCKKRFARAEIKSHCKKCAPSPRFGCTVTGCDKRYRKKRDLEDHVQLVHMKSIKCRSYRAILPRSQYMKHHETCTAHQQKLKKSLCKERGCEEPRLEPY